ncbi:hypothetical protein GJV06_16795 [Enterobacteriaceae bacterium RIT691]|nr:hypothetical protein [Enterobacteriaceae bacterium RIT691]
MLKLPSLIKAVLFISIFYGAFCYFSKPQRIESLNSWLQLLVSGGVLTPLATYAWTLKGRFEKSIEIQDLSSLELGRLNNQITIFILKIWRLMFFYVFCACIIAIFKIFDHNFLISRILGSLSLSLLFSAVVSAIQLRNFDVSLANLKASIAIRKKRNEEKNKLLTQLSVTRDLTEEERKYFITFNNEHKK